jgi:hypothetical protein
MISEILPGTPFGPRACRGETADQAGRCRFAQNDMAQSQLFQFEPRRERCGCAQFLAAFAGATSAYFQSEFAGFEC